MASLHQLLYPATPMDMQPPLEVGLIFLSLLPLLPQGHNNNSSSSSSSNNNNNTIILKTSQPVILREVKLSTLPLNPLIGGQGLLTITEDKAEREIELF